MAASAMPGARAIRFLPPPATTPPDVAGAPPLGYAGLLLVREAGEGGRPPLQIHRFGEPDQVIALARPIEREGAVTGVLYATFDPLLLEGWLKGAVPEEGYAELHQNGEGEPLRLAAIGNAGLKGGEPPVVTAVIPGTAWRLACWLPGAPPPAPEEEMLFFAPFAVAAAAIALLFALLALLFGRLLHGDLVTLVRRMGGSNREERGEVRLAEFQEAVQVLEAHRPPAPPFEAPPAPRIRTMADLSSSMNGAGARNEPPVAAKEAGGATKG